MRTNLNLAYAHADATIRLHVQSVQKHVAFKRLKTERQIAYGEVYAPNDVDTHGEFMTREDIEQLAHKFMLKALSRKIDVNHDNQDGRASAVESFVARDNDPDFTPGSWVLGVKVFDSGVWGRIKSGEISGFSMQARVRQIPMVVEMEDVPEEQQRGRVNPAGDDGHSHDYWILTDRNGNAVAGQTSEGPDGHTHIIRENNRTDVSNGHIHTYNMRVGISLNS